MDPYAGPYSPGTYMWKTDPPSMRGADWADDGCADVLAIGGIQPGNLNRYNGNCAGDFAPGFTLIGTGWNQFMRLD